NYSLNTQHIIDFGFNSIYYKLDPGSYEPVGSKSLVKTDFLHSEQALESAAYAGDQYRINQKLTLNDGTRYSIFNYLGPGSQFNYTPGIPKDESTIKDTFYYRSGQLIKTYGGSEVRLSMRYSLNDSTSLKLSYNTLRQY